MRNTLDRILPVAILGMLMPLALQGRLAVAAGQSRDGGNAVASAARSGTGLLAGTVTIAGSGQPAAGARVIITGSQTRRTQSVLTNNAGQFLVNSLPEDTFTVRATMVGYIPGAYGQSRPGGPGTPVVLGAGEELRHISFQIAKGGAIAGTVFDERGAPSIDTPVRVMAWAVRSGERRLINAGGDTTDDRGMYRVYSLPPGDYVVSAIPHNPGVVLLATPDGIDQQLSIQPTPPAEGPATHYAPVFYPSATHVANAQSVRLGLSGEHVGADIFLQRVTSTTVSGQVIVPPEINPAAVLVRLFEADGVMAREPRSVRPDQDGTFLFPRVVPGAYSLLAVATLVAHNPQPNPRVAWSEPLSREAALAQVGLGPQLPIVERRLWAQADLVVDGILPPPVNLMMQEGLSISGRVSFNGMALKQSDHKNVRVTLNPLGSVLEILDIGSLSANLDADGRFTINGVIPGRYGISASGIEGLSLQSAIANGVELMDFPMRVVAGEPVPPVAVQVSDLSTELSGVLTVFSGATTSAFTVVIFPEDQRFWVPFGRRMRAARPASDGTFSFSGLPAGNYRIAAITDAEAGAWTQADSLRSLLPLSTGVRLIQGQSVSQDLRVR